MKIRCEYCGKRNDAERDDCKFCGAPLEDEIEKAKILIGKKTHRNVITSADALMGRTADDINPFDFVTIAYKSSNKTQPVAYSVNGNIYTPEEWNEIFAMTYKPSSYYGKPIIYDGNIPSLPDPTEPEIIYK